MKLYCGRPKLDVAWVLLCVFLGCAPRSIAQSVSEPIQNFQVLQGEPTSFGFVASQPGLISVRVQSQGVPITVTLTGPLAQPVGQSGTGVVNFDYSVTASDAARGSIWMVEIRAYGSSLSVRPAVNVVDSTTPRMAVAQLLKPIAWGTIALQHPPGDLNRATAELAARSQQQPQTAQTNALSQLLQQRQVQYQQGVAAAQSAQRQQLATQYRAAPNVSTLVSATPNTGAATVSGRAASTALAGRIVPQSLQPLVPPPPPLISFLSVSQGQPGDSVFIGGSRFGGSAGAVHFVVNPGMDLVARADFWSDSGIVAYVPSALRVLPYNGQLYVTTASAATSAPTPFRFNPILESAYLVPAYNDPDAKVSVTDLSPPPGCQRSSASTVIHDPTCWRVDFSGHRDEDYFYLTTQLTNCWIVDSIVIMKDSMTGSSDAYVMDSRVGTASPYVDVHWWLDSESRVGYTLSIVIKGPAGLPPLPAANTGPPGTATAASPGC